jgi:SAM-dependent methyltransferase
MSVEDLRAEYAELEEWDLTPVDVIDNGELLSTIPEGSQDFIVANHFLEHCEDPIRTIETHLSKLRPGGVLFYAVPDKRYTFDSRRPPTPLEHVVADHEQGAERSRAGHYDEWARLVVDSEAPAGAEGAAFEEWAARRARELEEDAYSIHMHVWTQAEFLELILHCRDRFEGAFDIEAAARQAIEFIVVLRKAGPPPVPPPSAPAPGGTSRRRRLARRVVSRLRSAASRPAGR